jgi:hypothetical protein
VLFLVHRFLSPWWRRPQVPPKRRLLQEPHGVTTQTTPFFNKLLPLSPQANYTYWSTATCRRNLVPTFVVSLVSRGQRGGSPTVVNLSFLDRSRYFSFKYSSFILIMADWTPFQTHCYSENLVAQGIRTRDLWVSSQELWLLDHRGGPWKINLGLIMWTMNTKSMFWGRSKPFHSFLWTIRRRFHTKSTILEDPKRPPFNLGMVSPHYSTHIIRLLVCCFCCV